MLSNKVLGFGLLMALFLAGCSEDPNDSKGIAESASAPESISVQSNTQTTVQKNTQKLTVLDISEREFGDVNAISLLFNTPIKPDQAFTSFIKIEPELGKPVLSKDGRTLYFTGISPVTEYDIHVASGLVAENGTRISKGLSTTVKTRALSSLVSFETDGVVMIPGKVDSLALLAINVPEADVTIYKVKPDQLVSFFNEYASLSTGDRWYNDETRLANTVDHLYSTRVKISEKKNQRNRASFPINLVPNIDNGGLYLATVRAPGGFDFQATWFTVSSIGIQARDYGKHTRFITQDAKSGALLEGVDLEILDYNNKVISSGTSDKEGAWDLSNAWQKKSPRLIMATKGNQVSVLAYHTPDFDLSSFDLSGRAVREVEHFVYSPRDIYRPGEELILSTLTRDMDGQLIGGPIYIELIKPDGQSAGKWRVGASTPGYYEFRHAISDSAPLGEWQAHVFSSAQPKPKVRFKFKVEEFLPERLRLVFNQQKLLSFNQNDLISVPVVGEYLYGAPAAGNRLDTLAIISGWASPFDELKDFRFGEAESVARNQFSLDSVELNSQGETTTELNKNQFDWNRISTPTRLRLSYSLFESGGRAINRTQSVLLWPRSSFIGVKPRFKNNISETEQDVEFDLVRADGQGNLLAKGEAKATLYRIEEKYFWSHTPERGWHYQIEKNEYPVANDVINFADNTRPSLKVPVEWGRYRLELDDYEGKSKTVYRFQAGEGWYNRWNSASDQIRPDKVTVALDKAAYKAGDKVKVRLASPTEGRALVLLETDQVLSTVEVKLDNREAEVEIQLPQLLARHDAYISAFVIAPTDQKEKVSKRSFGIAHLPLDRSARELDVKIDVADKLLPESRADIKVRVNDKNGNPVTGDVYITLSAVDSGVLSVTGYKQPDPFQFFYGQRRYNASITDMYDDLAEPVLSDQAEVRWGGDGELERGGEAPPSDVQIVSLFSSIVKVEQGEASIPLELPAFDGELTLNAVAMGSDQFGTKMETTKVASPVVAQLSMPRFLAIGDEAVLALDLANVSGLTQDVEISIDVQGSVVFDAKQHRVQLDDGQKQIIHLPVKASAIGEGDITAEITLTDDKGKVIKLHREWSIGVRAAYPATYGQISEYLKKGEKISFPADALQTLAGDTLKAQLRVADTPDLGAANHFKSLMRYPYACLEQTTSKSQPIAVLFEHEELPEFAQEVSNREIEQRVNNALARYTELQKANGSFGLWDKFSPEEHWLTAYATDFLLQLKQSGVSVPEPLLNNARNRLNTYVHKRTAQTVKVWTDIPSHYEISYRAYAAYLLAQEGRVTLGPLREMAEKQLDDARGVLPGVHLGLAMIETGSVEEGEKLVSDALSVKRAEGYLGDYGSVVRDQSMAMYTIIAAKSASEGLTLQALQQLPELLVELKQQRWLSTQEKAALLRLASELYQLDKDGNWTGDLVQGQIAELVSASGALGKNIDKESLHETHFINKGDKPVFASFSWTGLPIEMPSSLDEGVRVRVDHFKVVNEKAVELKKDQVLKIGEVVLTRVRLYSEKPVPDGLLVNLIPAGVELENQNLQNALKLDSIQLYGKAIQQEASIVYQAYKDDRYVAAVNLPAKREQTLYFLSRAVTPGSYAVPPAMVESMYKPSIRGISNSIKSISVMP
ncbi:alpha-2-macroglobulin [Neptuniibacter sp. 2_MG-2023]|uniref:alpha-2-macroglobulin family protein n=1 Tax=Neptuniibacter sp. 2_MG-2023 TaxID=3062671 RepID=UPI0026E1C8D4|nr:alpha-2-macroglobulin [Neptuniibacter sp. 2_MG-2023]MDO6513435.1 alpha-2-macroglobulin [Neptuniibacter sp. 2_MG-2023]